jgi:hypothetical protein
MAGSMIKMFTGGASGAAAGAALEAGAGAAAATLEAGAVTAAATLTGGAAAAAVTEEGGAAAAAATIEGGAATAAATLEAGAAAAAAELAAGGAAGGAKGLLAGLAGKIPGVSGVGSIAGGVAGGAVLALPAIIGAGLALWWGSNEVKNSEANLAAATKIYEAQERLTALATAAKTGRAIVGLTPEAAAKYAAAGYTHYGLAFNARGQALSEPNRGKFDARGFPIQSTVNVTIHDQTTAGVKASQLDSRSNSPSAY